MYVKRVIEDNWSGVSSNDAEFDCVGMDQVVAAIKNLNGQNKTSVYLLADGERSLCIGGGNDGRFIVFLTIGVDDDFYNLVDLRQPSEKILDVVTGGQGGTYPARQVVHLEAALEAARQFATNGSMSPTLKWERQS